MLAKISALFAISKVENLQDESVLNKSQIIDSNSVVNSSKMANGYWKMIASGE